MNDGNNLFSCIGSSLTTPERSEALQQVTAGMDDIAVGRSGEGLAALFRAYGANPEVTVDALASMLTTKPGLPIVEAVAAIAKHAYQRGYTKQASRLFRGVARAGLPEGFFYVGLLTRITNPALARACFIEALDTPLKGNPLTDEMIYKAIRHLNEINQQLYRCMGLLVTRVALHQQTLDMASAKGIPELRTLAL
jgi:hypothetical protein